MTAVTSQDAATAATLDQARRREFVVLLVISGGLIAILLAIIVGIFGWLPARANQALPNWAENVLVSIGTAAILKLGDCLNALVQLASGRQVMQLGEKLAASAPADPGAPPPKDAVEAAEQMVDAAKDKRDDIVEAAAPDPAAPEPPVADPPKQEEL